jgi:cell division protein FtsW
MFIGRIPFKYIMLVVGAGAIAATILITLALTLPDSAIKKIARLSTWKSRIESFVSKDEKNEVENGGKLPSPPAE